LNTAGNAAERGDDPRRQVLLSLLAQRRSGRSDRSPVLAALSQMHQQPRPQDAARAVEGPAGTPRPDAPKQPPLTGGLRGILGGLGLADAITSGERSVGRNRAVGGSPTSNHLPGGPEAFDLNPNDPDVQKLLARARSNPGEFRELFGPFDWHIRGGRIIPGRFPAHDDHVHVAR